MGAGMGDFGGWRILSDEPSPISHLRVLHLCLLLWLPVALLPSAEWAPHCPSALDIPSHSAGFVWTGLGVPRPPLAEGTQVISAMENSAMWSV